MDLIRTPLTSYSTLKRQGIRTVELVEDTIFVTQQRYSAFTAGVQDGRLQPEYIVWRFVARL